MSAPMSSAQRGVARLAAAATAIAALALVALVVLQLWQVVARYGLGDAPGWTEPLALLMLATTMMFGAAAGVHDRRHFAFALLGERLPPRAQRVLHAFVAAVVAGIGVVLAGFGGLLVIDGWDVAMAGVPLPQGLIYLPIAIGGALMALFALAPAPVAAAHPPVPD